MLSSASIRICNSWLRCALACNTISTAAIRTEESSSCSCSSRRSRRVLTLRCYASFFSFLIDTSDQILVKSPANSSSIVNLPYGKYYTGYWLTWSKFGYGQLRTRISFVCKFGDAVYEFQEHIGHSATIRYSGYDRTFTDRITLELRGAAPPIP